MQSNKAHSHDFAALTQAVGAFRRQLAQPAISLFEASGQPDRVIGLPEALESFAMQENWQQLDQALLRIESVVNVLNCPILGVAGLLNSGKSSLVASYLSAAGRRRILRGDTSDCGTQRFVFWLPEQWRQEAELWSAIVNEISGLFAGRHEMLSDEPQQAQRQYNQITTDQQMLDVPLIATDPGLHNLAVLDCPDVQRTHDAVSAARREAFLRQAVPICSAFLFVTTQKNIADEKARKVAYGLRDMMPDAPFHLVMNQVEPDSDYPPHLFWRDQYIKRLIDALRVEHFYIAYHYRIADWQALTPPDLHALVLADDKADRVPAAWRVLPDAADNRIASVQAERYLINLPQQLMAGDLGSRQMWSHWHRFQAHKRQTLSDLSHKVRHEHTQVQTLHRHLLEFCQRHTTDRANNPRLPLSPELIKKLHLGMEAGAPAYIRPLLLSGRKVQEIVTGGLDAVKKALARVRLIDKDALYALKSQALNAKHLSDAMRQTKLKDYIVAASQPDLQQTWDGVLQKADLSAMQLADQLDDQAIAGSASDAWRNISFAKKTTAIAQGMLALLLSLSVVLLIPFDFGASAVVLAQASVPELIAAAGLGGLSGWGFASTSLARTLEQELFMPYFSDLFYFACDAFGLPRQVDDTPPSIQLKSGQHTLWTDKQPVQAAAAWCQPPKYWRQNEDAFKQLEQSIRQIERLLPEAKS